MDTTHYELEALVLSIPDKLVSLGMIDQEDEYTLFYVLREKIEYIRNKNKHPQLTCFQRVMDSFHRLMDFKKLIKN